NMPWENTKFPGIQIKVLYADEEGLTTALFKLEPGAVVPLHEHTALEQTYVLEGTLEDHEGVCTAGQFVWRPAGNQHEARAPNGALILGFFVKPKRFAYGENFFTEPGERWVSFAARVPPSAGRMVAMAWLAPVTLSGGRVRLEPLSPRHCHELSEAVADG